jgi:hypothetical protein
LVRGPIPGGNQYRLQVDQTGVGKASRGRSGNAERAGSFAL